MDLNSMKQEIMKLHEDQRRAGVDAKEALDIAMQQAMDKLTLSTSKGAEHDRQIHEAGEKWFERTFPVVEGWGYDREISEAMNSAEAFDKWFEENIASKAEQKVLAKVADDGFLALDEEEQRIYDGLFPSLAMASDGEPRDGSSE